MRKTNGQPRTAAQRTTAATQRRKRGGENGSAIPYLEPKPLPDGLHVAPWRSWDGSPLLIVIEHGYSPYPPLRLAELRSPIHDDPFPYSAEWLAGYLRPWTRGVYLDPHAPSRDYCRRYLAIDSHGRLIHVALDLPVNRRDYDGLIRECREALLAQDPVIRPRPRGQNRF